MRKKNNPHHRNQSDPEGQASDSPSLTGANYAHYIFEISYPENLMEYMTEHSANQLPVDMKMPNLPDSLFENLPDFLKKVVAGSVSKEERELLLMGAVVSLSACLSNINGLYGGMTVYPNLYLFVNDQSSAGNGRLSLCKKLVSPIHEALKEQNRVMKLRFEREMKEYKATKGKDPNVGRPIQAPDKLLLIDANNRSEGILKQLSENDGIGLIFETGMESMAKALKTEYIKYTDGFRKGYHHEMISYFRLSRYEYREIETPRISLVLSGTHNHLYQLIRSSENGLFSRFIFYFMNPMEEWNIFPPEGEHERIDRFGELGQQFLAFYDTLNAHPEMNFHFTPDQVAQFNYFFSQLNDRSLVQHGVGFIATIRRLGLIAFRLAMIFSALRIIETGDFSQEKECLDVDFQASISIVRVLVVHASHAYQLLPDTEMPGRKRNKKA